MNETTGNETTGKETIGRVLSSTLRTARVEFSRDDIEEGMLVELDIPLGSTRSKTITAKIDKLELTKYSGLTGTIYYLDRIDRPPKYMTDVRLSYDIEDGIFNIGKDSRNIDVKLSLNPLFGHLLVSGMTGAGKTHFMIVLLEELIKQSVPSIVFDSHGEFVNLVKYAPDKVVNVEDIRIEDCISYLQQRKVIIYNLLGLLKVSKANRLAEILSQLKTKKEEDYARAENNQLLLRLPPILIFIDEAEIYAPNARGPAVNQVRSAALPAVMDIAKEGAKFGLGLIVAPQRVTRLDIDVRGQCNSSALFRFTDLGSRRAIAEMDYITGRELDALKGFRQGDCLLTGRFVKRPRIATIRDLESERAKDVDFAEMLGIFKEKVATPFILPERRSIIDVTGNVIDVETGEIIQTAKERMLDEDNIAFTETEGDGVVLRESMTPEEEKLIEELRVTSRARVTSVQTDEEEDDLFELPFKTHLTREDKKDIKKMRKKNGENDL